MGSNDVNRKKILLWSERVLNELNCNCDYGSSDNYRR